MKNGTIGTPRVAYDVAAAVHDAMEPASVMPSSSSWPSIDSWYESSSLWSTGSYFWPSAA